MLVGFFPKRSIGRLFRYNSFSAVVYLILSRAIDFRSHYLLNLSSLITLKSLPYLNWLITWFIVSLWTDNCFFITYIYYAKNWSRRIILTHLRNSESKFQTKISWPWKLSFFIDTYCNVKNGLLLWKCPTVYDSEW